MSTAPPTRPSPPPPAANRPTSAPQTSTPKSMPSTSNTSRTFKKSQGAVVQPQKVIVYGPGGIGKSELCANMQNTGINPIFVDIGDGTAHLNIDRYGGKDDPITTWEDLRSVLQNKSLFGGYNAVVIDDLTKAEELSAAWVVRNVKHEKGKPIHGLADYGWGKGLEHNFDAFINIFGDLDAIARDGLHAICIAHDCTEKVPNPSGDDFIRYAPRLQSPKSTENSIRLRAKEWCDHLLFIGYDTFAEDGKAKGSGTRTIYSSEMPTHVAKSRIGFQPLSYYQGSHEVWDILLKGNK